MAEKPPSIEEVLHSGEEVEWAGKRRTGFKYGCLLVLVFILFLYVVISFLFTIFVDSSQFLIFLPIQLLVLVVWIFSIYLVRNERRYPMWYFITSKRILQTKGTRIVKEIDRTRFGDISLHEFVSIRLDHHGNERGSDPYNDITIHDPVTSEPLIVFHDIWYVYSQESEFFHYMQDCPSCGVKISVKLPKCLVCGQSFV